MLNDFATLLPEVLRVAKRAGSRIMPYFGDHTRLQVRHKADKTPITKADIISHETVLEGLSKLSPNIPVLSEEGDIPKYSVRKLWEEYWLCDPLDGTQGFLRDCEEFSVNIALIQNHQPVLGVIYSPIFQLLYYAYKGNGSYVQFDDEQPSKIQSSSLHRSNLRVIIGRYHSTKRLARLTTLFKSMKIIRLNSSLKFGFLADGKGDIYLRYGPTGEWDTAAGQCILEEAGGLVVDLQGEPLHYNQRDSLINPPFLAIGERERVNDILSEIKKIDD